MKNLHNIKQSLSLTDKELAALWYAQTGNHLQHLKFTYVNGKLHDDWNNSDRVVEQTWNFSYSVLRNWETEGRPMPDLSVIKIK